MEAAPTSQGRATSRIVIGALTMLLTLTTGVVGIGLSSAVTESDVTFGCPGTMVIANVVCERGVATAYDDGERVAIADRSEPAPPASAPWCDGRTDTTIYGCFGDPEPVKRLYVDENDRGHCNDPAPTMHPDGLMRAFESPCKGDVWIRGILIQLAENKVFTDRCLAQENPTAACIP